MAIIGNTNLTLLDHAKRFNQVDGKIMKIVEQMNKVNQILDDLVFIEGNTQTGHKTTIRTGIPSVAWRLINKGVQPSKSTTKQIDFVAGMLEARGVVDEELVNLAADAAAFRLSENSPYLEAMAQTLAQALIYGDASQTPEKITGLTPYYSASSGIDAALNVIKAGGASANAQTSLWLVVWGENTIHAFYPKGTKAGIEHKDLGLIDTDDGTGTNSTFMAWKDQYKAKIGLAVRDWRYAVRICNIDYATLSTAGDTSDTSPNLIKLMIQAKNKIPSINSGKAVWYANQDLLTALENKALAKVTPQLTIETLADDTRITKFLGIPVRRVDSILNTEAVVS